MQDIFFEHGIFFTHFPTFFPHKQEIANATTGCGNPRAEHLRQSAGTTGEHSSPLRRNNAECRMRQRPGGVHRPGSPPCVKGGGTGGAGGIDKGTTTPPSALRAATSPCTGEAQVGATTAAGAVTPHPPQAVPLCAVACDQFRGRQPSPSLLRNATPSISFFCVFQ